MIGKAGIKNLPPETAGSLTIEVTLKYDLDGVIEVVAKETQSGAMVREVVMQKSGTLSSDIVAEEKVTLEDQEL